MSIKSVRPSPSSAPTERPSTHTPAPEKPRPAGEASGRAPASSFEPAAKPAPVVLNAEGLVSRAGGAQSWQIRSGNLSSVGSGPLVNPGVTITHYADDLVGMTISQLNADRGKDAARENYSTNGWAVLDHMVGGVRTRESCANFVQGVLKAAGMLPPGVKPHVYSVPNLAHAIEETGSFRKITPPSEEDAYAFDFSNIEPGSVVVFMTDKAINGELVSDENGDLLPDPQGHVAIFVGCDPDGNPMFIGANSVDENGDFADPDHPGDQVITKISLEMMEQGLNSQNFGITAVYEPIDPKILR